MKIGFYSPYLDTFGGGERYILTLASHLSKKERVEIFWNNASIKAPLSKFLKIDLSKTRFTRNIFEERNINRFLTTKSYDLVFILSDGSIPLSFAKKNILHFQVPFIMDKISRLNRIKLKNYKYVVTNSYFTKKFIDKSFNVNSRVIYPPVDIDTFSPKSKEKIILSVGRFGNNQLHVKKQEVLIEVFKELYKTKNDWKLYLVGQAKKKDQSYLRQLRKISSGYAIRIIENAPRHELKDLYSKSAIYWHATGFGEDELKSPQKMEHFGISTVEASASGAVPIVINLGGQKEIITNKKDGLLWSTKTQLLQQTLELIDDRKRFVKLSQNAIKNSKRFSKEVFVKKYEELIY